MEGGMHNRAADSVARILESDEINKIWSSHHVSRSDDNPALGIAQNLHDFPSDPELLAFMSRLVELERGALGSSKNPDVGNLRRELDGLAFYLADASSDITLPALESLPEDYQKILKMIERQTAQVPFRPIGVPVEMLKHTAQHIWEDAKEHPKSFAGLLTVSLGGLGFMNMRMGTSTTSYIDPEVTTITNLSLDALDDPDFVMEQDSSLLNLDLQPTCHDHLTQLLGETGADAIKSTLDMAGIFPQHCSRVKTLAADAQASLQGGYDFINSRIGFFIKDPATDLAGKILPDSPFKDAFYNAANNTADFIYAANTVENVVLHTIIFASAMATTVKFGTLENEEGKIIRKNAQDFFHRTIKNNPLNYVFGIAASAQSYMANEGLNPEMIWMGLGGVLAGHFSHAALKRLKRTDHVKNITAPARENLEHFSDMRKILSDNRAGEPLAIEPKNWKNRLKKAGIISGGLAALASADAALTGGQISGNILGFTSVTVPFLAYNVPEDAGLHVIFGVAGGAAGAVWAAGVRGKRALKRGLRARKISTDSINGPS